MNNTKLPQRGQLYKVGATIVRVLSNDVAKRMTTCHHHGSMRCHYTADLKLATDAEVREYLGK